MSKKILNNTLFLTLLSLVCFFPSVKAEQEEAFTSGTNKAVAAKPKIENSAKQKEQLALHPSANHRKPDVSSSLTEVERVNETQENKQLFTFLNEKPVQTNAFHNQRFIELGLEYPINFGVHLRYLLGESFYTRFGLSFMPRLFLNSFKKLSPSFGYLNEEEADLISNTFENSIYIDFRLAWAPYLQKSVMGGGPYLELGLSGTFYGNGELKGAHLSKVITNSSFEELKTYSVKTNAYNATVHAGYQIPFEMVKLNIEVGLIKILHADILSVKKVNAPELLSAEQKQKFKNFLKKKGWIFPTVSGWISFAF